MKPIAPFLTSIAMMLSAGTGSNALPAVSGGAAYSAVQITEQEVEYYLEHCEHRHNVLWVEQLSNGYFMAGIENCGTSTVEVTNGRIVKHLDQNGICND